MHFNSKKYYKKYPLFFTKNKKTLFFTIKINSKLSLQFDCWFFPKTPSGHVSIIISLCQAFYQFVFKCTRNFLVFIAKVSFFVYYITRCEQTFPFAKLFLKKSVSQKLGTIQTSNFTISYKIIINSKKYSVLTRFILLKITKICLKKSMMRWLMV